MYKILWIDDEIDLLQLYINFLKENGYYVETSYTAKDALPLLKKTNYDVIILDEQLPGIDGLTFLKEIRKVNILTPIIMLTKSEDERHINEAIAFNVSNYLIKPINPKQLLSALKKITEQEKLTTERTIKEYHIEFNQTIQAINRAQNITDWINIYNKLVYYSIELQKINEENSQELLDIQFKEANNVFSKFVKNNYLNWINDNEIIMSHNILQKKFIPFLRENNKVLLLVIDNLRYDHLVYIIPLLSKIFNIQKNIYISILPTATSYSRNALFAGLMPSEIEKIYPNLWISELEDENKNQYEEKLFTTFLNRNGIKENFFFKKILNLQESNQLVQEINNLYNKHRFGVIVINFIDILSHSQPQVKAVKELTYKNFSFRSLIYTWFEYSNIYKIMKFCKENNINIFLTTDHGSIQVENPIKILGEKNITTNLRYKYGRNIKYPKEEVFVINEPKKAYLPQEYSAGEYIFAISNTFFAYVNNFSYYVNVFKNTYQHGGVSLEEMFIPYCYMICN